jgi:hypothetical protein
MHDTTENRLAAIARALGVHVQASRDETLAAIAHELGHALDAPTIEGKLDQAEALAQHHKKHRAPAAVDAEGGKKSNSSKAAKVPRRGSSKGKK